MSSAVRLALPHPGAKPQHAYACAHYPRSQSHSPACARLARRRAAHQAPSRAVARAHRGVRLPVRAHAVRSDLGGDRAAPAAAAALGRHVRASAAHALRPLRRPPPVGVLSQLRASFSPASALGVDSLPLAAAAFVGTAASLAGFGVLSGEIAAAASAGGFTGDPASLLFLDLHFGYSPQEAASLLQAYTHEGRLRYLAVEALDVSLYHTSYRALFLVLLNRATAALAGSPSCPAQARDAVRRLALIPLLVAALDGAEDAGQVALTLACDAGADAAAPWWPALTVAAAAANMAKWTCVRFFSPLAALLFIAAAATRLQGSAAADESK
jgi:hypothetical protein